MRLPYEEDSSRYLLRRLPGRSFRGFRSNEFGHDVFGVGHERQCEDVEEENDDDEEEENDDEEGWHVRRNGHEKDVRRLPRYRKVARQTCPWLCNEQQAGWPLSICSCWAP